MNDKKNTTQIIDELLDSNSDIKKVAAPPFFKERVLREISANKENKEPQPWMYWMTPKFQWMALGLFVLLNFAVLYYYNTSSQEKELETFASSYGFASSEETSILK